MTPQSTGILHRVGRIKAPLSRDKADTLLLLLASILVLAPQATHLPLWTSLICVATLGWRAWVTFQGKRMPPRWILLPVAGLAMAAVYWSNHTFFGREPGVAMLALLLAFKLLEMHAKRDLYVVMFLSLFLILTNFLYSQSIGTALTMVAAIIAILTAQLSFQYTNRVPPLRQRLRFAALIFALAIPLTLVLFVLFPRISGPLWGLPNDAHSGHSGLSDSMAPGNVSSLALSDEVAFRVKFNDPPPGPSNLYWRGPVLGSYDGRTWTILRYNTKRLRIEHQVTITMKGPAIRHQVTLEPTGQHWLYTLELPRTAPFLIGNRSGFTTDMQLLTAQAISQRVRYDAISMPDYQLQANETIDALQQWLELPPGFNPRTLAFADTLRQQNPDKAQRVTAVLQFFRHEKFRYTLEPPLLGKQAVDEFLFTSRAGFCEHYAGAFVVLMRAMNIPARVVTGYQGGEINPADGFMTVRQSDAHAWAEVWLEQRGWLRIDPTAAVAPERVEKNLASAIPGRGLGNLFGLNGLTSLGKDSWLGKLRNNWSAVTNSWNQWVLDYTPERQKSLLESFGFANPGWHTLALLMIGLGSAVMAVVLLPLLRQSKPDPAQALYHAFCRQMARRGLPRAIDEGPRSYGARLALSLTTETPEKQAAIARFLQIYESAKYANHDTGDSASDASKTARQRSTASTIATTSTIATLKSLLAQCR